MVFDAGSSHTSLFVYEWDSDKQNNTGVKSQQVWFPFQQSSKAEITHIINNNPTRPPFGT